MAKLTLSELSNLQNETSAVTTVNTNSSLIEDAVEDSLSRGGASDNSMNTSLDMNSNRILNLPAPIHSTEPVRLVDINSTLTVTLEDLIDISGIATKTGTFTENSILIAADSNGTIRQGGPKLITPNNNLNTIYQGFNFQSLWPNNNQLFVQPGTISNSDGTMVFSTTSSAPYYLVCDVSTQGVNTNWTARPDPSYSLTLGGMLESSLPAANTPVYFYLIYRLSDKMLALVGSGYEFYSTAAPYLPVGWDFVRKMRYAVNYKPSNGTLWSGLPAFFQDIDNSRVILTGAGEDANYRLANQVTGTNPLSLGAWVPNASCRTVKVFYVVEGGTSAGTAYIRQSPAAPNYFPVGQTVASSDRIFGEMVVKLDSSSNLDYQVLGGSKLTLYLKEYWFDEQT